MRKAGRLRRGAAWAVRAASPRLAASLRLLLLALTGALAALTALAAPSWGLRLAKWTSAKLLGVKRQRQKRAVGKSRRRPAPVEAAPVAVPVAAPVATPATNPIADDLTSALSNLGMRRKQAQSLAGRALKQSGATDFDGALKWALAHQS